MFAQHPLLQASSLGAFERMQDAAGKRRGATDTAAITINPTMICFNIAPLVA